ncbi:hypothetical protein [Streptomyces camelliae]|uniref:Uncharacterized protein n=1 Tax=Streptomyces camelliae TaxID=3004093 RepID=A0ABY7PG98_9ACTN|nr:hypothetical protein [Streptomyces sp. HUAS 2-6]WBO68597.1 hypothetical protein O1G22_40215 [Streptomyces sp. HUAS 2-6]
MKIFAAGGMPVMYDRIGVGYQHVRRPDPRPAELIHRVLGGVRSVVNAGAGSGAA